jgi:GGDEF domain-containing protein
VDEPESAATPGHSSVWTVLERAGVPLARLDDDATLTSANLAFARACGRPRGELVGAPLIAFAVDDDRDALAAALDHLADHPGDAAELNLRVIGADGRIRALQLELGRLGEDTEPGGIGRLLCVARDRSQDRRREREERRQRVHSSTVATTDAPTGLPNRRGLELLLASANRRSGREHAPFAVLRCDLQLPEIGSGSGDALVAACLARLRQCLRAADSITRIEPHVLVVLAEDLHDEQDAAGVAYRLLATTVEPVPGEQGDLEVGMTVGIAMGDPNTPPNTLLAAASEAATNAEPGGFRILDLRGLDSL